MRIGVGKGAAVPLEIRGDGGSTLLATLNKQPGRLPRPDECQISLSQVGPSRAKLLDLRRRTRSWCRPSTSGDGTDWPAF